MDRHWVKFELVPEYKNIEGAQEWLDEVNERMNTPEIEGKFQEEYNQMKAFTDFIYSCFDPYLAPPKRVIKYQGEAKARNDK